MDMVIQRHCIDEEIYRLGDTYISGLLIYHDIGDTIACMYRIEENGIGQADSMSKWISRWRYLLTCLYQYMRIHTWIISFIVDMSVGG